LAVTAQSKASAALQKTRRTLTGAYRGLKQTALLNLNGLPPLRKRKKKVPAAKPLSPTQRMPKSERWQMAVLLYLRQKQNGHSGASLFAAPQSPEAVEQFYLTAVNEQRAPSHKHKGTACSPILNWSKRLCKKCAIGLRMLCKK